MTKAKIVKYIVRAGELIESKDAMDRIVGKTLLLEALKEIKKL